MAWTSQQQSAIDARGTSLIVPAAAGSGKTAVLTERLIKLIADAGSGIRADRMIVVTFTNDAAAELKKRLDMKLRALINERPDDRHLLRQQILLQSAKISTINSFCFELLRDNLTDQGITSGFGILDESDNTVLKAQAMDELLDYYAENDYDKISMLYDRFCIKDEKRLTEVIRLCDEFLASVALREVWLEKAVSEYSRELSDSVYIAALTKAVAAKLKKALRIADSCREMIPMIFSDMTQDLAVSSLEIAEEDFTRIERLVEIFASGRIPEKSQLEAACNFPRLKSSKKAVYNEALREIYKKRRESVKKLLNSAADSVSSLENDYAESCGVTNVLVEVIRKYEEIVWAKKCEKNAISFDDGERLALELLAETDADGRIQQSEIARRTADFYDIIMIDEYQDSNNKEDLIFKLISRGYKHSSDGEPMYGENVFLVGDVKQSIYGFRLANPKNFVRTLKNSDEYDPESSSVNQSIVLNRNFRSSEGVIDFVNYVFGQIMSEKCGDIAYDEKEMLYFGAQEYADIPQNEFRTQINLINDDTVSDDDSEQTDTSAEAVWTAAQIAEMLRDGAKVAEKDGTVRPCRPSDFCILVRTNRFINIYADQLEKIGVHAKRSEESGYLKSREISVLIDLLRIISNPLLDIPMMAVLTSPMYMFTAAEIGYIKSLDPKLSLFPILRQLADGVYEDFGNMFLAERCRDFLSALDKFRLDSVTMTLGELISSIYDTTDFISVMQLDSDGDKKRANLRALIQYARSYEDSVAYEGTGGLSGFLRHIDRVMRTSDFSQVKVSAETGDYVVIQTFHGSKGLEYPFVFIAETSVQFKFDSDIVMCSDDGRIGYVLFERSLMRRYRTFQQIMLTTEKEISTRSEEMRLLYVGLTRARQRLFINLKTGEKPLKRLSLLTENAIINGGDTEDAVTGALCFADWLWAALMKHKKFAEIAAELGIVPEGCEMFPAEYDADIFDIQSARLPEKLAVSDPAAANTAEADEKICGELRALIGSQYDMTLSEMPAKLSVTQITKKIRGTVESFDFKLRRPKFASDTSALTGAERGTAIHTFFQYCSFDNARRDICDEIERVQQMGYITFNEAASISIDNAAAFFESELYARISRADNVWREKKFMAAVSQLDIDNELMRKLRGSDGMIKGIIDLMFEENGKLVIVDYKSDRGASAEKLAERYKVQLQLYRAAAELTMDIEVSEAYLYSFELRRAVKIDLD